MTLTRPVPPILRGDRPADPAATAPRLPPVAPPRAGVVKRLAAGWIAAHPGAGLATAAAAGAVVGRLLKRR